MNVKVGAPILGRRYIGGYPNKMFEGKVLEIDWIRRAPMISLEDVQDSN